MSSHRSLTRRLAALPALALAALALACGGGDPVYVVEPIPVGYDASPTIDADVVDHDGDGDGDILAATEADLRYLEFHDGKYRDNTQATALNKVPAVQRLCPEGPDYILVRPAGMSRLVYSGIGSWHEEPGPVPAEAPAPVLAVEADLNGDGLPDRARLVGRGLQVEFQREGGRYEDVSAATGADGLYLPRDGTRLVAADLDGDGDMDLLTVGGRLVALVAR